MIITAPSSKSYALRAIICASLAQGETIVDNVGHCGDIQSAIRALCGLGAEIRREGNRLHIKGIARLTGAHISAGESGFLARTIAALGAVCRSTIIIDGQGTLLNRSMKSTVEALTGVGAEVTARNGAFLPMTVSAKHLDRTHLVLDAHDGSQTLSGLLIALPLSESDTLIEVENLTSKPYIDLTINILRSFGISIQSEQYRRFTIEGRQSYKPTSVTVEGDWSGAAFFFVARAIARAQSVDIMGLTADSMQADRAIIDVIKLNKGRHPFHFKATDCPDLIPALVALAAHCDGVSTIEGARRLEGKESNRANVLQSQMRKLSVRIDLQDDTMVVYGQMGRKLTQSAAIDPHGDHRIAMAAAIMGRGVQITDKQVVNKSFPDFWEKFSCIEPLLNQVEQKTEKG